MCQRREIFIKKKTKILKIRPQNGTIQSLDQKPLSSDSGLKNTSDCFNRLFFWKKSILAIFDSRGEEFDKSWNSRFEHL